MNQEEQKDVVADDGLGICRRCSILKECPTSPINIGSIEYFKIRCPKKNLPCCLTRQSLASCRHFRHKNAIYKNLLLSIYRGTLWLLGDNYAN